MLKNDSLLCTYLSVFLLDPLYLRNDLIPNLLLFENLYPFCVLQEPCVRPTAIADGYSNPHLRFVQRYGFILVAERILDDSYNIFDMKSFDVTDRLWKSLNDY